MASMAFAQSIINPSDSFYDDLRVWETLGLVSNLPPLRPYPEPLVRSLLEQVINSGNAVQSEKARVQQERLFGKLVHVGAEVNGTIGAGDNNDMQLDLSLLSTGHLSFIDIFSFNYELNLLATNKTPGEEIIPAYSGYRYDTYQDNTAVGLVDIFASFNSTATVGSEKIWFQAGMSRTSWGNFYDNGVVINPSASHTGNMAFVLNQPTWNYTLALFMLSASTDAGDYPYPEKFMATHAIKFSPLKWLEIAYYENAVYGKRIEPLYFLPVSPYMVSQQLNGYAEDNIQMGLEVNIKPWNGFSWATNLFVDDLEFADVIKFDFDTKIRVAAQTGVTWIPPLPLVSLLALDYTLVTPYTYAHYDYSDVRISDETKRINYQNYTHNGKNLGVTIPPNSDRVTLTARFEPLAGLRLNTSLAFIRHANVNESLPTEYIEQYLTTEDKANARTDGSVMDSPNAGNGQFSISHEKLLFMEQETKQYVFQFGIGATWELPPFKFGRLSFSAAYTFEYIKNNGVDRDMFPSRGNPAFPVQAQEIYAAKAAWKAQLHDTLNNYIWIGARFAF
ncbi:MAG: hypothetical protein LBD79_05895 [Treponema sp.]|nr:hypothetical protein [Treponema sp.]